MPAINQEPNMSPPPQKHSNPAKTIGIIFLSLLIIISFIMLVSYLCNGNIFCLLFWLD